MVMHPKPLLQYFQGENFGDALNGVIWEQMVPGLFTHDYIEGVTDILFFGIGSIVGRKFATEIKEKVASHVYFSSGYAGYFGPPPAKSRDMQILCVRGPLTAKKWDLPTAKVGTDGAILLSEIYNRSPEKRYRISYMPHWRSPLSYIQACCERAGVNFIDPGDDVNFILDEIKRSEVVYAEAMHGLIAADALRVPWVPVRQFPGRKQSFKRRDWYLSMSLSPREIIFTGYEASPAPAYAAGPQPYLRDVLATRVFSVFFRKFESLFDQPNPANLSTDTVFQSKKSQLLEVLMAWTEQNAR